MNYHIFREIADSWVLLALFVFFIGTWFWAFRPGSKATHEDAANVVFRNEDAPATDTSASTGTKDNNTGPEGQQ